MGLEGIVSKRKDSAYRSGRSPDWLKMKNSDAPAVKREAEEEWGNRACILREPVKEQSTASGAAVGLVGTAFVRNPCSR